MSPIFYKICFYGGSSWNIPRKLTSSLQAATTSAEAFAASMEAESSVEAVEASMEVFMEVVGSFNCVYESGPVLPREPLPCKFLGKQ